MSVRDGVDGEASLVRPFLARPFAGVRGDEADGDGLHGVRAYAITGGLARVSVQLEFETMLQATTAGRGALPAMKFERADIVRLASREPQSVAELAARMRVPIGAVRVVAADLLAEGLMESFHPSTNVSDDVLLISRLIAGVRAL